MYISVFSLKDVYSVSYYEGGQLIKTFVLLKKNIYLSSVERNFFVAYFVHSNKIIFISQPL
jgi:hypothetical protein